MRKTLRHTGVLMMLSMVALGLVGAAYTLWYEDLDLHANIKTGTFDVDWSCAKADGSANPDCDDESAQPVRAKVVAAPYNIEDLNFKPFDPVKEAGKAPVCDIALNTDNSPGKANDVATNNNLQLTLSNLYPYSGCRFWIDIDNKGTTPAHFTFLKGETAPGGNLSLGSIGFSLIPGEGDYAVDPRCYQFFYGAKATADGTEVPAVDTESLTYKPLQLHQGDRLVCHFIIYLKQFDSWTQKTTPENANTVIWLYWRSHQWNETIAYGPGSYEVGE